jgi:hypothetical protein
MINTRPRASVQRDRKEGWDRPILSTGIGDALDDAQLIIESDEELPAGSGKKMGDEIIRTQ